MSAVSPLPNLKRTLRKSVQQILKTIPAPSVAAQSNAILATLLTHPAYTASRSLSIYLSLPNSEIETLSIVQHALSQGKNVFVPWTPKKGEGDGRMRMVRVERDEVGEGSEGREKWERDGWGIPVVGLDRKGKPRDDALTPSATYPPLDLILLPGVAFSTASETSLYSRLGHGKGYYDSYISNYRAFCSSHDVPGPKLFGLALKEQMLEQDEVPMGEYDVGLDEVLVG